MGLFRKISLVNRITIKSSVFFPIKNRDRRVFFWILGRKTNKFTIYFSNKWDALWNVCGTSAAVKRMSLDCRPTSVARRMFGSWLELRGRTVFETSDVPFAPMRSRLKHKQLQMPPNWKLHKNIAFELQAFIEIVHYTLPFVLAEDIQFGLLWMGWFS